MRRIKLILLIFSFVFGYSTCALAAIYSVEPSAADSFKDGTQEYPFNARTDITLPPSDDMYRGVHSADTEFSVTTPVGENFVRDGIEQRYWGVNINLQTWHTLSSIERMVARISKVGFNAIRLWPNWWTFYGTDVRNSLTPPSQGFTFATYVKGDGSQLDRFDKMIYECRQKNLPIYMTALMYYPPLYTTSDYVDLVTTDAADRQAWIEAMTSSSRFGYGQGDPWWVLQYIDERAQEIWKRHALLFLNHINQYTGLRNADDNNIIMWQLHNEGRFLSEFMLNNDYRTITTRNGTLPPYFQHKIQSKFNAFLTAKYGTMQNLLAAWGTLNPDESLELQTVDAGAKDPANVAYGKSRVIDFTEFAAGLVDTWNQSFTSFIRAQGSGGGVSVAAIATDTSGWPGPAHFTTLNKGSMIAVGTYPESQGNRDKALENPWTPMLQHPSAWGPYDFSRPAGKPAVIYETNYNYFALFDAELPWVTAAMLSWQNYSGVFWYFWNAPYESEEPAPYGQNVFTSRGSEFWGDEIFSSALQSAGEAFLQRRLPTAPTPTQFSIKESIFYNPDWREWRYSGIKPEQFTLSGIAPNNIGQLLAIIQGTAFASGSRVQTVKEQGEDLNVTGTFTPFSSTPRTSAHFFPGVDWYGPATTLTIDRPTIKAFTGYLASDTLTWPDGYSVKVNNMDALGEGALHEPFVAISLSSIDDTPLSSSSGIRVTAVSHSFNADMSWTTGSRVDPGTGALVTRRPDVTVTLPPQAGRRVTFNNFAFGPIGDVSAATGFSFTADDPVYEAITYILPTLSFIDNVETGPVTADTISASWGTSVVRKWDYASEGVCSSLAADYTKSDSDVMSQSAGAHNGAYICLYGEDASGHATTLASANPINIDTSYQTLQVTVTGTGGGTVTSAPQGINPNGISCPSGSCSSTYPPNSTVELKPAADNISTFGSWDGACKGNGACSVTMDGSKAVSASFDLAPKARIGATPYGSLLAAYTAALSGDTIMTIDSEMPDSDLDINAALGQDKQINISGGWKADYSERSGLFTALKGQLQISSGRVAVDGLELR